jgi:hypothetical protein
LEIFCWVRDRVLLWLEDDTTEKIVQSSSSSLDLGAEEPRVEVNSKASILEQIAVVPFNRSLRKPVFSVKAKKV